MKKTQKSFRKKALLSSMSMLMVATVAVGSATFAWFKSNPNANAQGLVLQATASKGLVIMTETHKKYAPDATPDNYLTTDYLNFDNEVSGGASKRSAFSLTPASLDLSGAAVGNAYTTTADSNLSYEAGSTSKVTSATMGTDDKMVYKEAIYCALTGMTDSSIKTDINLSKLTLKFNANASALKNSIRVVIGYQEWNPTGGEDQTGAYKDEVKFGQYALADAKTSNDQSNKMLIGDIAENTDYTALVENTNYKNVAFTTIPANGSVADSYAITPETNKLGTLGQTGKDKVNVYIYLDGEDEDCFSNRINANNIIESVRIDLSIPTT